MKIASPFVFSDDPECASNNVDVVQFKLTRLRICEVVLQGFFDGAKRNLVPRYFMLGK